MSHPHEIRHMTASAVVIDGGMVLLVHHRATGVWMFPGGHVDAGEDPAQAALREVFEETSVQATIVRQRHMDLPGMRRLPSPWMTFEIPAPAKPERPGKPAEAEHSHIDFLFLASADRRQHLVGAEHEVSGVGWFDIRTLDQYDVRAEVPTVARLAWDDMPGRQARGVHGGITVVGNGAVSISNTAVGHGATVVNRDDRS